jgi:hypothetical protein
LPPAYFHYWPAPGKVSRVITNKKITDTSSFKQHSGPFYNPYVHVGLLSIFSIENNQAEQFQK